MWKIEWNCWFASLWLAMVFIKATLSKLPSIYSRLWLNGHFGQNHWHQRGFVSSPTPQDHQKKSSTSQITLEKKNKTTSPLQHYSLSLSGWFRWSFRLLFRHLISFFRQSFSFCFGLSFGLCCSHCSGTVTLGAAGVFWRFVRLLSFGQDWPDRKWGLNVTIKGFVKRWFGSQNDRPKIKYFYVFWFPYASLLH